MAKRKTVEAILDTPVCETESKVTVSKVKNIFLLTSGNPISVDQVAALKIVLKEAGITDPIVYLGHGVNLESLWID